MKGPGIDMVSNCKSIGANTVCAQPTFICSKLTIQTPDQGVKYVQS